MYRRFLTSLLSLFFIFTSCAAHAILSMELTRGVIGAIPIAIVPMQSEGLTPPQSISDIISNDLRISGRFKVFGRDELRMTPSTPAEISADYFKKLGTDHILVGRVKSYGDNQYRVNVTFLDVMNGNQTGDVIFSKEYTVSANALRVLAHHISDMIYERITGTRGVFSTRLAYVVVENGSNIAGRRYVLEVTDMDGYNPRPILTSREPIMSPAWGPDGNQIAYVSFEKQHAGIYLHNVRLGQRKLLSFFPGINGAPAWSPDGKKLAVVLSKSGSPNVYVIDILTKHLRQLTNDYYINTEPAWSPDGKSLLFTSNRGGGPQIYKVDLASNALSRVTYDGSYNARPSFTKDGNHIAMIHRVNGEYKIGLLDLDTGSVRVLTGGGDNTSPSIAPNGAMILYDTVKGGKNMLGMVSADGRVQLTLPARNGDAQDPAWSPFLAS